MALATFVSCEEFQPVFTGKYPDPEPWKIYTDEDFPETVTIAELVKLYKSPGTPVTVKDDIVVKGTVSTNDQPGNFYKSLYIQDATGGIEVKIGKNGLYNDYKPGQTLYIKCKGLELGMYGYKSGNYGGYGMVSIGYKKDSDDPDKYETSSLDESYIINTHVFRGEQGELVQPVVISDKGQLPKKSNETQATNSLIGKLVTIKGLSYANEAFVLVYVDPNQDKEASKNRIFLSGGTWGITTWALTEERMKKHLVDGDWDEGKIGSGNDDFGRVGDLLYKVQIYRGAMPYSVSQYFVLPGMTGGDDSIQVRTSGFCKFADTGIDPDVLSGDATVDLTGIITLYQGKIQLTLIDMNGVKVNK